jgi:hypothetical protein
LVSWWCPFDEEAILIAAVTSAAAADKDQPLQAGFSRANARILINFIILQETGELTVERLIE